MGGSATSYSQFAFCSLLQTNSLPLRSILWDLSDRKLSAAYYPTGSKRASPVRSRHQGVILKHYFMPKVKTNSSAKKRFKVTGTGKISFQKAFKRHILTKKSKKRKRNMNKKGFVSAANTDFVKRLLRLR
jgi:large subunit ribosomal protein L35